METSQTNDKTCPKWVNAKLIWLKKLKARAIELSIENRGKGEQLQVNHRCTPKMKKAA